MDFCAETRYTEWYQSDWGWAGALTDQPTPRGATLYWGKLKQRIIEEGSQLLTNCQQLKLRAADGKMRLTDVANTEQLLRIIQSIPSKKPEPFKTWLARVGAERIDETIDPELAIDRALETYLRKGYSEDHRVPRYALTLLKSATLRVTLFNDSTDGSTSACCPSVCAMI